MGQKSLDAHKHRIPASKLGKIHDFCSGGLNTKGGAKGWHKKGMQKGGHHFRMLVPIIYTMIRGSDGCFRGQICIFWHSHCVSSHIATRPPFAPPFSSFRFMKNIRCQIFPESKMKFVRLLGQDIQRFELQKLIFCEKMADKCQKWDLIVKENHRFCLTINSNSN